MLPEPANLIVPLVHALLERCDLLLQFGHIRAFRSARLQVFDLLLEPANLIVPLVYALLERSDFFVPLRNLLLQLRNHAIRIARAGFQLADAFFQFQNIRIFFRNGIVRAIELRLQLRVYGGKIGDALVERRNLLV